MAGTIEVLLWRGGADGRYQAYEVPLRENQTVLDVVTWVQRNADATLSYRFACRVGMCGSCAMTVNGRPRWTCRAHVSKVATRGRLTIGPLENLPVIKDLATADAAIECINCGVCHAACDTVRWNPDFLGPAALNRAWTLVNDERDAGNGPRLAAVASDGGCHACHSHQSCQEHCPVALNPTASIAGLKRRTIEAYLRGEIKA